jgi:hypothetical protein
MNDDVNLKLAKQHVAELKGFYIHFGVFIAVMCALFAIDAATGPDWWVQWPFLGWGVGVAAHAAAVFWHPSDTVDKWETRKVAEVKRRLDERLPTRPNDPSV